MIRLNVLVLLSTLIFSMAAFAMNGHITYQAKIVKPDGYPLEAASVSFQFTVLDTAESCILYSESYTAIDMRLTGGLVSFALGNGVRSYPASGTTAVFANTFDNSIGAMPCQTAGVYNPGSSDTRKIVMQFNDGSGWQTLPALWINAVPYAMYATKSNNSLALNGKADTDFVENSTLAALNCNPATHAITFNGASFSCIPVGVGGGTVTSVTTSGTVLTTGGTASAPVISITAASMSSDGYLTSVDYAEFKAKLSASSTELINTLGYTPVSGAAVASQIDNSNLSGDVSGTISANTVAAVGGKTAAQISTSVDDTLAATSSLAADTIVKRNASGSVTVNDIYASSAKVNYVDIYKPSTSFNIRLQAPTALAANYVLNLPTTSGTVGQVLSTDGSGNLSWINPSTGSVTSVSGTAGEITSTGGSSPAIGLADVGTAGTYYKVITDGKGRVTSGVTTLTLSDLPNTVLNTTSVFAGDISGIISNITVNRIQGVSVTVAGLASNDILQYDGTNYVNKNIPTCAGSQYLTFNGTNFTCVADAGASGTITTLSVTGPISSTGGANPTLSIAQANTTTDGYLSSTDWNTFNNKQTATSAAIIATLGYTPADSAASGSYVAKANNLSDLASATIARTNLGLGSLATLGFIDLGSAEVSGTLAIARLPSFAGDATIAAASNIIILSNSGVTAGTYTKVTVDAKGRVTSSSALSLSDVTTALGYTPADNAASGTYLVKASNLSDLTDAVAARTNLGLSGFATINSLDLGSASATGTVADARLQDQTNVTSGTQYTKVAVDGKGRVTSGTSLVLSDLPNTVLSTISNFAGDISGMISNISVNRIQGVSVTVAGLAANDILQYDGAKYVNKNIPTCAGANYLTFNGTNFTCVVDAGASGTIASLSVTGPISSTGGANPTLSIAQANGSTDGYLSSTDWTTFNNKQTATSAAIIATLGYTPADNAVSGSYVVKANNLSDLTDAVAARSNLGLSGFAIINSLDLGSASATGIIADARLQNQTNVTSGAQYTKVTVDSKGRVTSGAQLSSSDVTTALGYTPATSGAADASALHIVNNLSDVASATAARTNLGLGSLATLGFIDLGSSYVSGTLAIARLPAFAGDVTSIAADNTLTLSSVGAGVTSGTQYTKVTVDGKGRVTSGALLSSSDVTTALGYTPGNATSGVTSLNGSTSQTQTFANGASGNSPAFNTLSGVHTLNIPLASATGSVTAGLISNADYVIFSNKQQATSSAIIATLGYTPADNSVSGSYVAKANNLSDLTDAVVARTNLGLSGFATINSLDLGSASATGIVADARLQTQTNVTSGTQYTKLTVDGKGRVTSGAQLSLSDVTAALGYTPADNAASGTYLVKASNLSDVASATVARTNLGLGFLSTLNFLDLGSSYASGTLSIARLPAFAGDVTSIAADNTLTLASVGAGVTSGTQYTKVTVDGKGRVTSGAQLSLSDVTTALGYTAANSATVAAIVSSQWTTSGTAISYTAGNVGIGTTNPTATLDVNGHFANSASATPTLTACGSGAIESITGNDMRGVVTVANGNPTACTINFASAYATAPHCVITPYQSDQGSRFWVSATTTTNFTVAFQTGVNQKKFMYICIQ